MSLEFFAELFQSAAARLFKMFLADWRTFPVENPELIMIASDSRSLLIFEPSIASEFIDLALIVSVRFEEAQP